MQIIELQSQNNRLTDSDKALITKQLRSESIVVYPTDTLYGLGADVFSEKAIDRLYQLKLREDSPVSVLAESVNDLLEMTRGLSEKALQLIQHFLPGPMTVICHTHYPFNKRLFSGSGTIGFRVPGDALSRELPRLLGRPITTTSVNPAGQVPASSVSQVRQYYGEDIPLMINIGEIKASRGSTVIDLTRRPFQILREGEISRLELQDFLN